MFFKLKRFIARPVKLDNNISKKMLKLFEEHKLNYQLTAPGDHRLNPAEHAIQAFKNHCIAIKSSTFPKQGWHHILEHVVLTINMLLRLVLNAKILAYIQLHSDFIFNKTTIPPAGCKITIRDKPMNNHIRSIKDQEVSYLVQHSITIEITYVSSVKQIHFQHQTQLNSPIHMFWFNNDCHRNFIDDYVRSIVRPEVTTNTIACFKWPTRTCHSYDNTTVVPSQGQNKWRSSGTND